MRIGITYNLKSDLTSRADNLPEDSAEEFDLPETLQALQEVLASDGHDVFPLGGDLGILAKLESLGIDFVFNIAEGFQGRSREAHLPALLEMAGVPYSGSDPLALALTLDKALTKRIAMSLGIPTPPFWILEEETGFKDIPDTFPLFVKPLWQGSSKGIRFSSQVENASELAKETKRLFENYPQEPVLVESYIAGQEVTVGVLGNQNPEVMGVMEIAFKDPNRKDFSYSLEVKRSWKEKVEYLLPPRLQPLLENKIREASVKLFQTLHLRDVARFDFRVNAEGEFYFLEVNPLPGLSPESGDLVILAQKKGWTYRKLLLRILHHAFSRYPPLQVGQN